MNPRNTSECRQNLSRITKSLRLERIRESKSRSPFFRSLLWNSRRRLVKKRPRELAADYARRLFLLGGSYFRARVCGVYFLQVSLTMVKPVTVI